MSVPLFELAQLCVAFPKEHADKLVPIASHAGIPLKDVAQEASLIIWQKGSEYDSAKGSFCSFVIGHVKKRLRRQQGAHRYAVSLDSGDSHGDEMRQLIEALPSSTLDEGDQEIIFPDALGVAIIRRILSLMSAKSTSEIARLMDRTPRRVRQINEKLMIDGAAYVACLKGAKGKFTDMSERIKFERWLELVLELLLKNDPDQV